MAGAWSERDERFPMLKTWWKRLVLSPRSVLGQHLFDRVARIDGEEMDVQAIAKALSRPAPTQTSGKTVVILSFMSLPYALKMEAVLATVLQGLGYRVCMLANASSMHAARAYFQRTLGNPVLSIEGYLDLRCLTEIRGILHGWFRSGPESVDAIKKWRFREVPVGVHALATLSSMSPAGRISLDQQTLKTLKRLVRYSMLMVTAADAALDDLRPERVLGIERGFVGTCEIFYRTLSRGIDYVQWVGCHEPESIMLKRYRLTSSREHPFSLSRQTWGWAQDMPWHDEIGELVMAEFSRGYTKGEWFKYKMIAAETEQAGRRDLLRRLGIDNGKPVAVIYSHILSDANLFYGEDLFARGFEEWLVETVRAAGTNNRVNWVLKLHPANRVRNRRLRYSGEYGEIQALKDAFGRIPEFLRVVYPDEAVSPLSFFGITDWGLTVRGTVGLELPCFGIPVLTAGSGRYSGRGFTVDSASRSEYLERVASIQAVPRLTELQRHLALRYAYLVFKGRPAKYDGILEDTYDNPPDHVRHRDIRFRFASPAELESHPQVQAISRFLEGSDEDFLDAAIRFT